MSVILSKVLLSLLAIATFLYISRHNLFLKATNSKILKFLLSLLIISRLSLFFLFIFTINGGATSDVLVYFEEAQATLAGKIPLIEIKTAYGPLFLYIAAVLISIWNNAMVFIIASIIFEVIAFIYWFIFSRRYFLETVTRHAALIYILNPLTICNVPISGQNHIWIASALAISIWLLAKRRIYISSIVLGLSLVGVKFLSLIFAPVLAVSTFFIRDFWHCMRWSLGFLLIPVLTYLTFVYQGLDLFEQIRFHAHYNSSGNIPFLLTIFDQEIIRPTVRPIINGIGFLVLSISFLFLLFCGGVRTIENASFACAFVLLVVLLVSGKAFTSYLLLALFPICVVISLHEKNRALISTFFLLWSLLAAIEPSLWFRIVSQRDLSTVLINPSIGAVIFLTIEIVLITGYFILAILSFRKATGLTP